MTGEPADLFGERTTRLGAAYRRRARKIAARAKADRRGRPGINSFITS